MLPWLLKTLPRPTTGFKGTRADSGLWLFVSCPGIGVTAADLGLLLLLDNGVLKAASFLTAVFGLSFLGPPSTRVLFFSLGCSIFLVIILGLPDRRRGSSPSIGNSESNFWGKRRHR